MKIVRRKLTEKEAESFCSDIRKTPNITGYTIKELSAFDPAYIAEVSGRTVGIATYLDIDEEWRDFAVFFVKNEYRGSKIGSKLFETVVAEAKEDGRNLYVTTRTPETIHLAEKFGFEWVNYRNLPTEIRRKNLTVYLNRYRVAEFFRKLFVYRNLKPFRFAVLIQK